jgi:hypothetical protein
MEGNLTDLGRSPIHIDDVIDRLGCMQLQHGLMRFDALWLPTSGANRPLNADAVDPGGPAPLVAGSCLREWRIVFSPEASLCNRWASSLQENA